MILHILFTIVFFFILMYLSINLLGLYVRGVFPNTELDKLAKESSDFVKKEAIKAQRAEKWTTYIALILLITYLYLLFHFWNVGVMASALIIMAGRFPGLIWDIEHGRRTEPRLMKKNAVYYISAILPWLAFPVLYYSLYILK